MSMRKEEMQARFDSLPIEYQEFGKLFFQFLITGDPDSQNSMDDAMKKVINQRLKAHLHSTMWGGCAHTWDSVKRTGLMDHCKENAIGFIVQASEDHTTGKVEPVYAGYCRKHLIEELGGDYEKVLASPTTWLAQKPKGIIYIPNMVLT